MRANVRNVFPLWTSQNGSTLSLDEWEVGLVLKGGQLIPRTPGVVLSYGGLVLGSWLVDRILSVHLFFFVSNSPVNWTGRVSLFFRRSVSLPP